MPCEIYTISQTAKYLKVSDKTVRRLIERNELPASKVGRSWRITVEDIEKYLIETKNRNSKEGSYAENYGSHCNGNRL